MTPQFDSGPIPALPMKRILYYAWIARFGGAEQYFCDLSRGMAARGYDVTLCLDLYPSHAQPDLFRAALRDSQVRIVDAPPMKSARSLYAAVAQRSDYLRSFRPDLIHFNQGGPGDSWLEMTAARWLPVPVVSTSHVPSLHATSRPQPLRKRIRRRLLGWLFPGAADRYVVVSESNRDFLHRYHHVPARHIRVIHLGLDAGCFGELRRDHDVLRPFGVDPRHVVIGSVGGLNWRKAQHVLIQAADILLKQPTGELLRFVIVGGGEREADLRDMVNALGLSGRVILTGPVNHETIPRVLSRFDIYAMSSEVEGQPYALLEAMAAGLPVVTTAVDGIPDIVTHLRTGLLVPRGDYVQLADGLTTVLRDADLRQALGAAARQMIDERYRMATMLDTTEDVYHELWKSRLFLCWRPLRKTICHAAIRGVALARRTRRLTRRTRNEYATQRKLRKAIGLIPEALDFGAFRRRVLAFSDSLRSSGTVGEYRYAPSAAAPVLYASVYAAMLHDLLDDLQCREAAEKQLWAAYICGFQCEDGLFRDPRLANGIAETEDWWGWRHLAAHAVTALTCLGGRAPHPFRFLEPLYGAGKTRAWIAALPWQTRPSYVSNTVMNYGVLLQYERDFRENAFANQALAEIYGFLEETVSADTGLWHQQRPRSREELSTAVQTAYHLWILYFYDQRPIRFIEQAIGSCMATQKRLGGFGVPLNSSACEDIDTVDPLSRFCLLSQHRREHIGKSLRRGAKWILSNQMADGGFVFRRFEPFVYGHPLMATGVDESSLFATWFRVLSLAYASQVPAADPFVGAHWRFPVCPGYQFWRMEQAS